MLCTDDEAVYQTAPHVVDEVFISYKRGKVDGGDLTLFFNNLLANFSLPLPTLADSAAQVDEQVDKVWLTRFTRENLLITFSDQVVEAVYTNPLSTAEVWTISLCTQLLKTLADPKIPQIPLLKKAAILSVVARSLQENNLFRFEDGLESPEGLDDSLKKYFYDSVPLVVENGDNFMVQTILKPLYVFLVSYKPALTKAMEKPSEVEVAENLKPEHALWTEFCQRCHQFSKIADIDRAPKEAHVSMYYLKEVSDFIAYIHSTIRPTPQRGTGKRKLQDPIPPRVPLRAGLRPRKS